MKTTMIAALFCAALIGPLWILYPGHETIVQAQNPKPCTNVTNTAASGQLLSAARAGSTPPCTWVLGVGLPSVVSTPGDIACAYHADTTINQLTVTAATNAAPIVFTVSTSPITAGYYVGLPVTASASNPASYDSTGYHVAALDATHVTVDNGGAPGASWTSGTKLSMTCGNPTTDAIHATPYTFAAYSMLASAFGAGTIYEATAEYATVSPSAAAGITDFDLSYSQASGANNTNIYVNNNGLVPAVSFVGNGGTLRWLLRGWSATQISAALVSTVGLTSDVMTRWSNAVRAPVTVGTAAGTLAVKLGYTATGIGAAVCNDGANKCGIGTLTGTVGQTCNLTAFNGAAGTAATATVALTGTNVIANGTAIVITNTGSGYTGTSTTATAGNGTATCTGTAALTMAALGGAQGNALSQLGLVVRKN